MIARTACVLLAGGVLWSGAAAALQFQLINTDKAGVGLNDPTSFTPVGGNNATTLGQARLNAFNEALSKWGAKLAGNVTIRVTASFADLKCDSSSATLGQAGPTGFFANFPGTPQNNVLYPAALAAVFAGKALGSASSEIDAQFNSAIDTPSCLGGRGFYYGFDHNAGSAIDFPTVLMHEIGHGLGYVSLVDPSTGQNNGGTYFSIFDHDVLDLTQNRTFDQMTSSQRQQAAVDNGNLVWAGATTAAQSNQLSAGVRNGDLRLYAPTTVSSGSSVSHWDTAETPDLLMEPFIQSDVNGLQSVDFTTCALQDIGWTLTTSCPDGAVTAAPTANGQAVTTPYDTPVSITLSGTDPNNASLSYQVVTVPTHGALSGTAPSLRYTPDTGYTGNDTFQFTVGNGTSTSMPATVSVTVKASGLTANTSPISTPTGANGSGGGGAPAPGLILLGTMLLALRRLSRR